MDPQTYGQLIFDKAGKNTQWNKDRVFGKWCWENWTATCRRMNLDHFLTPYTKKKLKMDERPQCKTGSHQNPQGESKQKPLWSWPQQLLIQHISKGKGNKSKNELLGPHQIKSFCTAKETISKTKRQLTEWEKIFANDISDKGLVSKIYKELMKFNTQKTNNPVKKWTKDMNRTSPKNTSRWPTDTWKNAQHHSSSGKYKSKPQWDTTSRLSEWLTLTTQATDIGEDAATAGGKANWCSHSGKQDGGSSKR